MTKPSRYLHGCVTILLLTLTALSDVAWGATHTVIFRSNEFVPSALTVSVGDTVVFENQGGFHTVTGTGADPFCGTDAVPTTCSVTFDTAGTFPYRCVFHSSGGANPAGMVGSITVQPAVGEKPNLVPFHLNGWSDRLVVSSEPGDRISDPDFFSDEDILVNWAIANISLTTGIPNQFFTEIQIDGVSRFSWSHDGLPPDTFNSVVDFNIGKLPAGEHIFTLLTDHTGVVDESNENDNAYQVNVRVIPPFGVTHDVELRNFEFRPAVLTVKKGDIVQFRNLEGSHTVTGTQADPFCGEGPIANACHVQFDEVGTYTYRCLFHSTGGATPQGMAGTIRVVDAITLVSASEVDGPYSAAAQATVDFKAHTVTHPLPAAPTFWRLLSGVPLRITRVESNTSSVVIHFE